MAGPLAAAATKMLEKVWGAVALTCHSAEGNLMSLVFQAWDIIIFILQHDTSARISGKETGEKTPM